MSFQYGHYPDLEYFKWISSINQCVPRWYIQMKFTASESTSSPGVLQCRVTIFSSNRIIDIDRWEHCLVERVWDHVLIIAHTNFTRKFYQWVIPNYKYPSRVSHLRLRYPFTGQCSWMIQYSVYRFKRQKVTKSAMSLIIGKKEKTWEDCPVQPSILRGKRLIR